MAGEPGDLLMVARLDWHCGDQRLNRTLRQHRLCSGVQQTALDRLYALARSFAAWEVSPFTHSSGDEDLRARAAHYEGDLDVCLMRPLTLVPEPAALPPVEVVELIPQGNVGVDEGGVSTGLAWQGLPTGKRPGEATQGA